MKKKIGAFGARQFSLGTLAGGRPGTTIFQNPGGGGGLGGVAYKDRARPPPPWLPKQQAELPYSKILWQPEDKRVLRVQFQHT